MAPLKFKPLHQTYYCYQLKLLRIDHNVKLLLTVPSNEVDTSA